MRRKRKASRFQQPAAGRPHAASSSDISHNSVHATDPGPAQIVSMEPQYLRDAYAVYPSQAAPQHAAQQSYAPIASGHIANYTNSSSLGAFVMENSATPPKGFLAKLAQYKSCS